ncbi:MAG: ATP-binding cassette domain-containing protein [Prevotellaceae bacterium]|nr:ATP-binding cassette domain-containing protein [Prevotellaceae bacterium]
MFILQSVSYIHSDRELLFDNVTLSVGSREKVAVTGNNGAGKSTLLKIIAGQIPQSAGSVTVSSKPYYVPQIVGQFDYLTVAQAIGIADRLNALYKIMSGNVTEENLSALNDDWTLEERCREALLYWNLVGLDLNTKMNTLSGGQKTKVFLAGITVNNPEIVLLDEPTNHLDTDGRNLLYRFIAETCCTLAVVSHDRTLLNGLNKMCELSRSGIKIYGGNYNFYREQKTLENEAIINKLEEKQKSLRKARESKRETLERQQRQNARGKNQQKKEGTGKAMMDKMKNDAEKSAARLKSVHEDKINAVSQELSDLRQAVPDRDKMNFGFYNSALYKGKILFMAKNMNFAYSNEKIAGQICNNIWKNSVDFQIISGERIEISGKNGSGKTTLIKLITGDLEPTCGTVFRAGNKTVYIDQEYSMININLSVYQQVQTFNSSALLESEIKTRLNHFLFSKEFWDKSCSVLSGGEKMRLLLCCLTVTTQSPDIIILDEPTNNLDIQNIEILTDAVNNYCGTLIVVSHDRYFLEQINVEKTIELW